MSKDFNGLFRTFESKCRRCIYHSPEYAGDCELLAVGLRKIVGKDSTYLVCDDFVESERAKKKRGGVRRGKGRRQDP